MQLHQLKPIHKAKKAKRVGRGGKRGTYSGRGQKGQSSRAGRKFQPAVRELIKRYPKLKGYRHKSSLQRGFSAKKEVAILNLEILEKKFKAEEKVNPETLLAKGLISKTSGKMPKVKILGKGKITKALNFENCLISKSAKEKIEKSGGSVKIGS